MYGTHANAEVRAAPDGYSLVEVMVSVVIVGGLFFAAVQTLGASRLGTQQITQRAEAHMLAQGLMDEVLRQSYAEADGTFGVESGESASAGRSAFDDVDDYDGWSASPPTARDGGALPARDGWTRRVAVHYADPNDPMQTESNDTGVKRIHVIVLRGKKQIVELIALRGDTDLHAPSSDAIQP